MAAAPVRDQRFLKPGRGNRHSRRMILLFTDFGRAGFYVGQMKAALVRTAPEVPVIDLMHDAPRFDARAAAYLLAALAGDMAEGTVCLAVVDPGVGGDRPPVVVAADGRWFVGPGAGLFEIVQRRAARARQWVIAWRPERLSDSFHGRDLFAPVGGHLAAGTPFSDVGPVIGDWIRLEALERRKEPGLLSGVVTAIDEPFGNVWTNLPDGWLRALPASFGVTLEIKFLVGESVAAGPFRLALRKTFGEVPEGKPLVYVNSRGMLSLARNQADFARTHKIQPGMRVEIRLAGQRE